MKFFNSKVLIVGTLVSLAGTVAATQLGNSPHSKRPKLRSDVGTQPILLKGTSQFGDPIPGLDDAQLADFANGKTEFTAVEVPEGGLGPIFNGNSCAACHTAGAIGGASLEKVTRFGRSSGKLFDSLDHLGGSLLQAKAIVPSLLEHLPAEANVVSQRITTPLFGAGLIEAITDTSLIASANRPKPDGVRGKASLVIDVATGESRVGRFGWKAQQATLLAFAGDAYVNEMGITSRLFPTENAPNGRTDLIAPYITVGVVEDVVDPITGKGDIDVAADFMRLLAPPPAISHDPSQPGARVFERAGCAVCHTPVLTTGPNKIAALSNKRVPLFSDLLLHDMGSLGDGIEQGTAKGREMRTAPLWGLRVRPAFLHDGRVTTVKGAIEAHDGEARISKQRFQSLSPQEQEALLAYLGSI
jgi:CxxC motif-containing protein (DUF1111 family)